MIEHTNNSGPSRRKLSDVLNGGGSNIRDAWDSSTAAGDFAALPTGTYIARLIHGELSNAKKGTPGYKLSFKVIEGEHAGRQFWHDIWLTKAAMPMAKRDLGKLGVTGIDQLENQLPQGMRVSVKLALRKEDDGSERNRVKFFEVIGIDKIDDDDFPPPAPAIAPDSAPPAGPMFPASSVSAMEGGR